MLLGLTKRIIVVDAETASPVDLKKHGGARYWADKRTRTLMMGFQDLADTCEYLYEPRLHDLPKLLVDAAALPPSECMFAAFNAAFDYEAMTRIGVPTTKDKWLDIMLVAYILAFSGTLDDVLEQYDVRDQYGRPLRKSPEGKRLIKKFCSMQTPWYDAPAEWAAFVGYCRNDVQVEVSLLRKCMAVLDKPAFRPMIATLQRQWLLNQRINARGIPVSTDTIKGALKIRDAETKRLNARVIELTGCTSANSQPQLLAWFQRNGVDIDNIRAQTLRDALQESGVPDAVKEVIACRLAAGKASVKKFEAFDSIHVNGRLHNSYVLCGASRTGRDASRGANLANLERPKFKSVADAEFTIDLVKTGNVDAVRLWSPLEKPVMDVLGSCVRGAIEAPEGYGITAVDLKSIESVGLAWLAGCDTILDLFHHGKDTYKDFATRYYGIRYEDVTSKQRGFCKPPVLGAGYGASGPALVTYAKGLGVILEEDIADQMIVVFRTSFPEIPLLWSNLEKAAKDAIRNPGQAFYAFACDEFSNYGNDFHTYKPWPYIQYYFEPPFLYCGLPSGRTLFYYEPEIIKVQRPSKRKDKFGNPVMYTAESIRYWGREQKEGGRWKLIYTWGGALSENVTQALCRDVLYPALELIDADEKIELIGSTYDESINLTRLDDPTAYDRIFKYMTTKPPWMDERFFLGADGYANSKLYRKD